MNSKYYLYSGLSWLVILMTTSVSCSKVPENKNLSAADSQIAAKVNNQTITTDELDKFVEAMHQMQMHNKNEEQPNADMEIKKYALKKLIRFELLYQESQDKNLAIKDEELNQTFEKIKSQFPDEASFQTAITSTNSSEEDFKEQLRRSLSIEQLINKEVRDNIKVTDEETNDFYQKNKDKFKRPEGARVSHILVKVDGKTSPEDEAAAKQKIEGLKKRLDKGEDFAELARANSDCPSAGNGGDLGVMVRGQMVPEFEKCAFELEKPGQISKIIKTKFGFHVLKLGEKVSAGIIPYEETKKNIENYLKNQMVNENLDAFVQKLFAKAKIETQIDIDEPEAKKH